MINQSKSYVPITTSHYEKCYISSIINNRERFWNQNMQNIKRANIVVYRDMYISLNVNIHL